MYFLKFFLVDLAHILVLVDNYYPFCLSQWFPDHKGVVNGIIVAGFGGGAFIFDQVQTAFINPGNLKAVNASQLNTTQDIGTDKYSNITSLPSSDFIEYNTW